MPGVLTLVLLLVPASLAFGGITASFRYPLSNFQGPVPSQLVKLAVDPERNEVYTLDQLKDDIRVFDEHGMQVHVFGEGLVHASDITIGEDGDIFLLINRYREFSVLLCNYRGEPVSEITLTGVPEEFSDFGAQRILYRQGSLYLVDSTRLKILVVDPDGVFQEGHDLNATLGERAVREDPATGQKKVEVISIGGFDVDPDGNMLLTVPTLFAAFRLSPEGELTGFGRSGSGPGKFGVVSGIVADDRGYIYVSDRLRCVVMVFDKDLRFQTEFGYRGDGPSHLRLPDEMVVDGQGNLYVAQAANRGVSVFRVSYEPSAQLVEHEEDAAISNQHEERETIIERPEDAVDEE